MAITFLQSFLVTYSYVVFGQPMLFHALRVQPVSLPRSKAHFTSAQPFFLIVVSENEKLALITNFLGNKGQLLVLTDDDQEKWLSAGEVSLTSW